MTAVGATALAGGLSAAATLAGTGMSIAANQGLTKKAREENFMYNERAANNAFNRQKEYQEYLQKLQYKQYFDLESPQAIIEQLKAAGLSPSIYAGGALGNSISGVTTGGNAPQGNGASGLGAPQAYFSPLELSQVAVNMAHAKKMEEETKTEAGENARGSAEIAQILINNGATEAGKLLTEAQTESVRLQNYITDKKKDYDVEYAEYLAKGEYYKSQKAGFEAEREGLALKYDAETFDSRVQEQMEKVNKLLSDMELNDAHKNYFYAKAKEALENIKISWAEQSVHKATWRSYDELVAAEVNKFTKEAASEAWKTDLTIRGQNFNLMGTIIGSIAHVAGMNFKK